MKIRHLGIAMLLMLFALAPLAAQVQEEEADPPTEQEPVQPEAEEPWETEDDDPLVPEDDDPLVPEEVDPLAQDEDETALDVIQDHERTARAYELFGDEFAATLDAEVQQLAFFVPADEALVGVDREALSDEELREIAQRHAATGIVAMQSLEFVDSFMTMDGEMIMVSVDEAGNIMLNDRVTVIETIEVANGFVYIIDGRLDEEAPAM